MNAVVYYSNTGQSLSVARYFAEKLSFALVDMHKTQYDKYENMVLVFPVHCQNIPSAVKSFLEKVEIKNLTAVALYGKMCYGNVLYEIQTKLKKHVVAGVYVPAKHAYIKDDVEFKDFEALSPILDKIKSPSAVKIPKSYKNPFANLFPTYRSRRGIKLIKNSHCNGCGICEKICPDNAIKQGVAGSSCIRCMKCISSCPNKALDFNPTLPMKCYLRKKKIEKLVIYV